MRTLAVEVAIHHLDLMPSLPDVVGPSDQGLMEARRTLDALLGRSAPASWGTERYVRIATGRAEASEAELAQVGAAGDRFPLFG